MKHIRNYVLNLVDGVGLVLTALIVLPLLSLGVLALALIGKDVDQGMLDILDALSKDID